MNMIITFITTTASAADDPDDDEEEEDPAEEIVVTGTRTGRRLGEEPVAVEVITREEIERSGAYDLAELLDTHPGVDVNRDPLGASVRLRGLDADQVLTLVDGQRIAGRTGGVFDLSRFPLESIERVEIVKGPASALYGSDALGGVVHIITRPSGTPELAVSARAAGAPVSEDATISGDASLSAATAGRPGGVRITGGWHASPTYDLDPSDVATDVDRQIQGDGSVRIDPELGPDVELPLSASYARTDAQGIDDNGAGATFDRRTLTEDTIVSARPSVLIDESRLSFLFGLSVFRDQYLSDQRDAGALDVYEETWETLGQGSVQLDSYLPGHQLATVGFDGFVEQLTSPRLEEGTGSRQRGAVFLQDEWTVLTSKPRLALVPGVRVDVDSWFGWYPAPKLAARLDPHDNVTLRASAGLGWRAPGFRELLLRFENPTAGYVVLGNPDLVPEKSRTVDAAVELDPVEAFSLSVSGWWTRLDDLIDITSLSDGGVGQAAEFQYTNVDEARTRGIESAVTVRPAERLEIDLSYTFTDAWNLTDDRPLSGRAAHRGTVGLDWRVTRFDTQLGGRAAIVGPRSFFLDEQIGFAGEPSDEPTIAAAYALVDLRIAQPATPGLEVFLGVDNLLDAGDPEFLQVPPRLLYAGVDARARGGRRKAEVVP
jgi:outer membrane receptor for ferrienterochelin and colicins